MRFAFIGHSYHATTGSNRFLLELLRRRGEVELLYDESWLTGVLPAWSDGFRADDYDGIVVFQAPEPLYRLDTRHPNIVYVPMLDGHISGGRFWWHDHFNAAKIVCFSAELHREVAPLVDATFFAQYFPPVRELPRLSSPERLSGFLWYRKPPIDPAFLRRLTGKTTFDRFTVKRSPDPGEADPPYEGLRPLARQVDEAPPWLPDRPSYLAHLAEHTVYFAPRLYEGIGMGFLEAMGLGLCVVAPDTPTHNEYISHGATGLLYSPSRPSPLSFESFRELGRRARQSAEHRRELWESAESDLLDFLVTPKRQLDRRRALVDFWRHRPASPSVEAPAPASELPALTVVTVCGDPSGDLDATLASVREQDYPALEHLVLGAATGAGESTNSPRARYLAVAHGDEYAAMLGALEHASGEYVLFLPAGDRLVSPRSLRRLLDSAPRGADVVFGHFVSRDRSGLDQLSMVDVVGHASAQLDSGRFDPRWIERTPRFQATAFRISLLRRFGFDPALRFAADYDLHRRLLGARVRSHLSDCVVAHCLPEGGWARLLPLCAGEWLRLAVRHDGSGTARRVFVGLGVEAVEAWEQTLWGWLDRARRRHRQRFASGSSSEPLASGPRRAPAFERALTAVVRAAAWRLAALERHLAARRAAAAPSAQSGDGEPEEAYMAAFAAGIDFRRHGRPSFVARLSGISWQETWGRWTDGPRVELEFRRLLPRRARVVLDAFAFEAIALAPVEVAIGRSSARVTLAAGEPFRAYSVDLETTGRDQTLTLTIPLPPHSPGPRAGGQGGERRRLGLALRKLQILDLENP